MNTLRWMGPPLDSVNRCRTENVAEFYGLW